MAEEKHPPVPKNRDVATKYIVPACAVIGVILAIIYVVIASRAALIAKPIALPAATPFSSYISGSGLIEANTENIAIGTTIPGIVSDIYVQVGSKVKKGDSLFKIDDRDAKAALATAEAGLGEALAALADVQDQLRLENAVKDARAVSIDEVNRKRFAVEEAAAKVKTAKANLLSAQTTLDRLLIIAPVDGEVMKLNVRLGEYAPTGTAPSSPSSAAVPLIIFGNLDPMHVRIDIDENDAWRFKPEARAYAFLRGNRDLKTPLQFIRVEPYVTPKVSLTGDSTERVDTRVLEVIYSYDRKNLSAYAGQQVDVYIEADSLGSAAAQEKNP